MSKEMLGLHKNEKVEYAPTNSEVHRVQWNAIGIEDKNKRPNLKGQSTESDKFYIGL